MGSHPPLPYVIVQGIFKQLAAYLSFPTDEACSSGQASVRGGIPDGRQKENRRRGQSSDNGTTDVSAFYL